MCESLIREIKKIWEGCRYANPVLQKEFQQFLQIIEPISLEISKVEISLDNIDSAANKVSSLSTLSSIMGN